MTPFMPPALVPAFPEIFLAFMILLLLMLGVAGQKEDYRTISRFSILTLAAVAVVLGRFSHESFATFGGMFVVDGFGVFMKLVVIAGAVASIIMSTRYAERERIMRFEYPILLLFSTLGMMLMISAGNLMSLYIGLELHSLPLYVLAALQRDTLRSTEAGLKYFILGALASGLLLYGASLVYGYTGVMGFGEIAAVLDAGGGAMPGAVVGMVLVLCGLAFKVSAVPFHMWTPDVYEGTPTSVTAFFAIVPKVAALALLTRVLVEPFGHLVPEWRQVVIVLAVASVTLGALGGIRQENIKRLLAYSSIGHMGYALTGLAAASVSGVQSVMVYAAIYMAMSAGAFALVLMMKHKGQMIEKVSDLTGLGRTRPWTALAMSILMFSMAGIPPLAGFFGKLLVFQAAVEARLYMLAVIGVVASVVAAYYYLRVVKVMYFDEAVDDNALDPAEDPALNFVLAASSASMVVFVLTPTTLIGAAETAARALLQ